MANCNQTLKTLTLVSMALYWSSCNPYTKTATVNNSQTNIDSNTKVMANKIIKSEEEWKQTLTPEQYRITRQKGTERAFSGEYWNTWDAGSYYCVACNNALFYSDTKFDAGCGWPSFFQPIDSNSVIYHKDTSHGMIRTEVVCGKCDSHLGHVFDDGPPPTGLRFCMNSASLRFVKANRKSD